MTSNGQVVYYAGHGTLAHDTSSDHLVVYPNSESADRARRLLSALEAERSHDDKIAAAIEAFRAREIMYNRPKLLEYKSENRIVLAVASANIRQAEIRVRTGNGPPKTVFVRLSDRVRASLDGPPSLVNIKLEAEHNGGDDIRSATSNANATWVWHVIPNVTDPITLTLSIFNYVEIDGKEEVQDGPVYVDHFTVHISPWTRIKEAFSGFWGIFLGLGTLGGAAAEFIKWREQKKTARANPPVPAA